MTKAYSYVRFSTPEQAKGDSLRRQIEAARNWCEKHGLILDDSLRDLGVSAYRGTNQTVGALRKFLDLVERGRVERGSYLIVESLDRLSRETVLDAAARLLDLIRAGVTVVTLTDEQVYSEERLRADWTPLVMSITIMARAHEESRVKGARVGAAWKRKRDAARQERRPLTHRCPAWFRLIDGQFEVIPERAELVRRIYQMAIEGYGQRAIVQTLNAEGVPAFRTARGWQTSTLRRFLTSRTVVGEYQPHTGTHRAGTWRPEGDPIEGFYPSIIDEDTYWHAQRALDGRRTWDNSRGRRGASWAWGRSPSYGTRQVHTVWRGHAHRE
jgi:DNA invertase Pin-like site-specific DNA recombinase